MKPNSGKAALLGAMCATVAACTDSRHGGERPNIIFFLVDDMGWVDSSVPYDGNIYPNNLRFNTPNMERLARRGTIFSNAYACPVSTPTRTSLLSGMNAAHTGITNWTSPVKDTPSDATGGAVAMMAPGSVGQQGGMDIYPEGYLTRPDWTLNGMSPVPGVDSTLYATPMVQLLKDAGYFTIHVGKGHWASAGTPGASPYNMGFVVNVAGNVAGMPRSYQGEDNYGNTPERWNYLAVQNMTEYYGTHTHLTEALTREALKTLDFPVENGIPFYLYMSHHGTHTPIQRDDRFVEKYLEAGMDEGQARYASMVEGIDKSLGDILDYLDDKGIAENTAIIFMTDNGGNSENVQKGGVPHTQNLPLREGKGSVYEGGIRVPLIVCWPGKVPAGAREDTPAIAEDLFPTILDIAGVSYDEPGAIVQELDGQSLIPGLMAGGCAGDGAEGSAGVRAEGSALKGAAEGSAGAGVLKGAAKGSAGAGAGSGAEVGAERALIFHYPHQWKPYRLDDIDYLSAVRKGDWKLVYRMREARLELYNLREDIGETHDLAAENPQKCAELATILSDKLREWGSPMPFNPAEGKPVPFPDEL